MHRHASGVGVKGVQGVNEITMRHIKIYLKTFKARKKMEDDDEDNKKTFFRKGCHEAH